MTVASAMSTGPAPRAVAAATPAATWANGRSYATHSGNRITVSWALRGDALSVAHSTPASVSRSALGGRDDGGDSTARGVIAPLTGCETHEIRAPAPNPRRVSKTAATTFDAARAAAPAALRRRAAGRAVDG
jgi:hypothetical protein